MAGCRNEVDGNMNAIVNKARIAFHAGLFGKNLIKLILKVFNDFKTASMNL